MIQKANGTLPSLPGVHVPQTKTPPEWAAFT